jgi:hypothetical protein
MYQQKRSEEDIVHSDLFFALLFAFVIKISFFYFVHRPLFKTTTFGNWICFRLQVCGRGTYYVTITGGSSDSGEFFLKDPTG